MSTQSTEIKDYFDSAAATWDHHSNVAVHELDNLLACAHFPRYARVLDVACGTGVMIEPVLKYQPKLLRAIDLSPAMIDIALQKYGHLEKVKISVSDFYTFDESGFDVILIHNAYPHFMDKTLFSEQLRRCLSPNGRFIIAHSRSKATINHCHRPKSVSIISSALLSCQEEAERLGEQLSPDIMIDNQSHYILSGTRRP